MFQGHAGPLSQEGFALEMYQHYTQLRQQQEVAELEGIYTWMDAMIYILFLQASHTQAFEYEKYLLIQLY